jgi:hypothetical protein
MLRTSACALFLIKQVPMMPMGVMTPEQLRALKVHSSTACYYPLLVPLVLLLLFLFCVAYCEMIALRVLYSIQKLSNSPEEWRYHMLE